MDERDKELIDRGFAFVAKAVYIKAATETLMSAGDPEAIGWARGVLERLPGDKKAAPDAQ